MRNQPPQTRQRNVLGTADCATASSRWLAKSPCLVMIALWLSGAIAASAAPVEADPFAPCYSKGRPIECGILDQLATNCFVAEERYQHQEKVTRRCEAAVIGQRQTAAELMTDPKARQAAFADVAVLSDRLARSIGVDLSPARGPSPPPGFTRMAIGAQSGPTIYASKECDGVLVNGQCQGTVEPEGSYHFTCHGQVVDGVCTGPIF